MRNFIRRCYAVFFTALCLSLNAQFTPVAIDNTLANDCAVTDCWDFINWSPVQDGGGNTFGGIVIAEDNGCSTTIGATVEYTRPDTRSYFTGTLVGANTTDGITQNMWTSSFDIPLTNPIFDVYKNV